jgi:hypothetical protein
MHASDPPRAARTTRPSSPAVWLQLTLGLLLAGCSSHAVHLPPHVAGQIPSDYRLGEGRALVVAQIHVHTNGVRGFGAISNPMLMQFSEASTHAAGDADDGRPSGISLPDPGARVWTSDVDRPTLWQYAEPGLMAASFKPGTYDGLVIAYPDPRRELMSNSIPEPSQGVSFQPVELKADTIVYLGSIYIEQRYSLWDQAFDRVHVDFTVRDDADRTIANFRARYPQFRDTPVEQHLLRTTTTTPP